ncbi:homeobox protein 5-like, partial [Ceratitis capitata]|uniref:homeobox protein 5-like n=1 Tax=Ceratitis capitata TaxID=7213 RepID=UPI000C6C7934
GHQQLHLPQNSLGTGNDKYNETSYLLQHQQQMHIQHDQKLNIPVNEHRQHQGRQQKYKEDIHTLSTSNKMKSMHLNMNNNNKNNNVTIISSDSKQFIKLIKSTSKPRDQQSEQHNHHSYRIESDCKSVTSDTSHRESDESSLCDEFKPATIESMEDDQLLQPTSRSASSYRCSRAANFSYEHYKRNTKNNIESGNNNAFHKHKCIIRQKQQRQKELDVSDVMSKTSGNADDQESSLIGNNSFPGYESMPAVNENAMPFTPRVRPPSIGNSYSSNNSQHNILSTHCYSQQVPRPTPTLRLPISSPSPSLDEDNNGRNCRSTTKEMDEFSSWTNTIDQVSNVTDDINAYIHYQQRITGETSRSRNRSRSRSRSGSRSPCPSLSSKNSKQFTTINNDNDKSLSYKLHSCSSDDISLTNVTQTLRGQKETLQQQQQKPQLLLGKSTPSLVSSLVTLPQSLPQPTTLPSAAAAPAAAASHAQSPHHNAAAAVVVAAAAVAAAAASGSCTSGAPITSNFGSLLDVISGSGASAEKIDADFNDAMNAISNSTGNAANTASKNNILSAKKYYHPLYTHGICRWPGCELALNDFTAFVK